MDRVQIKEKSKTDLGRKLFGGRWMTAVAIVLVYGILTSIGVGSSGSARDGNLAISLHLAAVSVIFAAANIVLCGAMEYGLCRSFLSVTRSGRIEFDTAFDGFKNDFGANFLTGFLKALYTFLWGLLFVIPGIVKSYSYAMAMYLRNDRPNLGANEAITESRKLMDGHKADLFVLDLSFIGWYIVGALCLGVGVLWVRAYHEAARANFYSDLVGFKF